MNPKLTITVSLNGVPYHEHEIELDRKTLALIGFTIRLQGETAYTVGEIHSEFVKFEPKLSLVHPA